MKKSFAVLMVLGMQLSAQTWTLTPATPKQATPNKPGLNIAQFAYYGPGQFLKNLFESVNGAMEGWLAHVLIRCDGTSTSTSCVGASVPGYGGEPVNFFTGGSFYFPVGGTNWTGAITGCSGTISSSSGSGTYGFPACAGSPVPVLDDYLSIVQSGVEAATTVSAGSGKYSNYGISITSGSIVSLVSGDVPSATGGTYAMQVDATANSSSSAQITAYTDTGSNGPDVLVNGGTWTLTLYAKATSCTTTCTFTMLVRRNGSGGFSTTSGTLTPTVNATAGAGWQAFTLTTTPNESAGTVPAGAGLNAIITTSGQGNFKFKGLDFRQTSGTDGTNTSNYRDIIVSRLRAYKPTTLRFDWNETIRETLDNMLLPAVAAQRTGQLKEFPPGSSQARLYDFLILCELIGADPYFSIGTGMTTTEMSNLVDFLAATSGTYATKRTNLGHAATFTSVFNKIHIELGNETWNTSFGYEAMPAVGANITMPYGANSKRLFVAAKANPNWSTKFDFMIGCQQSNTSNCLTAHDWDTTGHDSITWSGYNPVNSGPLSTVNSTTQWTSKTSEAWGYSNDATNGNGKLLQAAIAGSSRVVPWSKYEYRENDLGVSGTTATCAQLQTDVGALGSGLSEAVGAMESVYQWNTISNMWDMGDYSTGAVLGGCQIPLFGASVGIGGVNDRDRPGLIIQKAINAASIGAMFTTSWTSRPTFNIAAINGHAAENGVPYLYGYGWNSGNNRGLAIINTDPANSYTITFAGESPAGLTATQTLITSTNITDTNETTANIAPVVSTPTLGSTYTIAAHTAATLTYSIVAPATTSIMFTGKPRLTGKPVVR